MEQIYQPGSPIAVECPFPDGDTKPTSYSYEVLSADKSVIMPASESVEAGTSPVSVTVTAEANTLAGTEIRGLRIVRFTFKYSSGATKAVDQRYVLERTDKLTLMGNTFQEYEEAILTRMGLEALDGWDAASEADRIPALSVAFQRMGQLAYRYRISDQAIDYFDRNWWWDDAYYYVTDMSLRKLEDWNEWPDRFKTVLRKAQVYEADSILFGDPVGDKREAGVVSETIGEAKTFFSNVPPIRSPLSSKTMKVLGPYLFNRLTVRR